MKDEIESQSDKFAAQRALGGYETVTVTYDDNTVEIYRHAETGEYYDDNGVQCCAHGFALHPGTYSPCGCASCVTPHTV